MIIRTIDIEAAGYYQAAWTVGGLYANFILQAMGADFYPRLTAVADNNLVCNRLVNDQTQVSLYLAGPGLLGTLTFASIAISLLYSAEFQNAVELLRWICLGMAIRVISWPIGFMIMAKGAASFFLFTELAWGLVYVGLLWICLHSFGLNGAGIAFLGSYVFHGILVYLIATRLSLFRWSRSNLNTGVAFLVTLGFAFFVLNVLPALMGFLISAVVTAVSGVFAFQRLKDFVSFEQLPRSVRSLLMRFRHD
jgi:PST family polysaccharide transporter